MKKRIWITLMAALLLLTGCSVQEPVLPIPGGVSGHASCDVDLATDGQRVYLLRTGKTLRSYSFTYAVYEVTGGGEKRIAGGRDADDIAVAEGRLLIASHTLNWLKAVQDSAEIDAYDTTTGNAVMHVSSRDEAHVNPDMYSFHLAGGRVIRHRHIYGLDGGHRHEFAFVDGEGNVGEPFWTFDDFSSVRVREGYILVMPYGAESVTVFDLNRMTACTLPALWETTGRDGDSRRCLWQEGVLLDGVLYYPAADGVHAYAVDAGQDSLLAAITAPEYFYVTDGLLYTAADDGFLTAYDLLTGEGASTGVALTKADRFVVAGEYAYILQTPQMHDVRKVGCRVAELK